MPVSRSRISCAERQTVHRQIVPAEHTLVHVDSMLKIAQTVWAFLCLVSYMIFPAFRGFQSAAENMHLAQCRRCFSRVFNFEPARQDRRAVQQRTHSNLYGNKAVL